MATNRLKSVLGQQPNWTQPANESALTSRTDMKNAHRLLWNGTPRLPDNIGRLFKTQVCELERFRSEHRDEETRRGQEDTGLPVRQATVFNYLRARSSNRSRQSHHFRRFELQ